MERKRTWDPEGSEGRRLEESSGESIEELLK